jgi:hypothetical protein
MRRADESNTTVLPAQSLAATPSALAGSLSMMVRSEGLEPSCLSAPPSGDGVSTEFPPQAHASLPGESSSGYLPTREACLPLALSRRELGDQDSNLNRPSSRLGGLPVAPSPNASSAPRALGGSRTRNIRHLGPASLPWLEYEHKSRRPVPTRAFRRTRAEPQPCSAASLGNQGSNLDSLASEASVLPDYTIPHQYVRRGGHDPPLPRVRAGCSAS